MFSCKLSTPIDKHARSLVEQLQRTIDQQSDLCSRLFPDYQIADLLLLDREQLRNLVLTQPIYQEATQPSTTGEGATPATNDAPSVPSLSDLQTTQNWNTLDTLDQAPELDAASDEITRRQSAVHGISDDVNGLSFSLRTSSSYVGVSSVNAALKAIFKVAPQVQVHLAQHCPRTAQPSRAPSPSPVPSLDLGSDMGQYALPPPDIAEKLIDSYFDHIHAMMPMIDEDAFRQSFLYDQRMDIPWLALFNVVLALGSLASGNCHSNEHLTYAKRAQQILSQKSLGSNNLLILQAHGLLSGYYLHWLNRPNEAHAMMGATMRIASAVGLHREYDASSVGSKAVIPPEVRRRTWWSLVCLDTWASMTTGRPSFGRLGPGITVAHPSLPPSTNNKQYLASLKLLPLVHNLAFCTLATHIQDLLATKPLLSLEELAAEDAKLVEWHDSLPPILRNVLPRAKSTHNNNTRDLDVSPGRATSSYVFRKSPEPRASEDSSCPTMLQTPRASMHWWYLTLRLLMHRPYLIAASLGRVPETDLLEQDRYAIQKCRILAGQAITTIDRTCQENLISGWNGVWLTYQAVMVPILSLAALSTGERAASDEDCRATSSDQALSSDECEWEAQIQTAIGIFDKMSSFSLAAVKSKIVVQQLLHACKRIKPHGSNAPPVHQSQVRPEHDGSVGVFQESLDTTDFSALEFDAQDPSMDFLWDDMAWESVSGTLENMPFANPHHFEFDDTFEL
jgi:hypothetical protein